MKIILNTFFITLFSFSSYSQSMVVSLDYHTPVKGKGSELSDAIKDKTKKYNQGADAFQLYTWEVIAGSNQGNYARAGVGPTWADFDNSPVSSKELDYWMENVDPLIASSSGREYYVRRDAASHDVAKPGENTIGFNIDYVVGANRDHFWKFRRNIANALKESGEDLSLNVWASGGGGPQGHVRVSFNFRNLEHYGNFRQIMGRVSDTYDEIYGNNAWDTDIQLLRESLEMWGAQTELVRFLPELSSPPIALQE